MLLCKQEHSNIAGKKTYMQVEGGGRGSFKTERRTSSLKRVCTDVSVSLTYCSETSVTEHLC